MTTRRKRIMIAIQILTIGLIVLGYISGQLSWGGQSKHHITSIYISINEMIGEQMITIATETTPQEVARRLWEPTNQIASRGVRRCQSWTPFILAAVLVNFMLMCKVRAVAPSSRSDKEC